MTQNAHSKKRVNFYIDGLNVYHRIRDYLEQTGQDFRWLDYRKLCEKVLRPHEKVGKIYFFTAVNEKNIPNSSIGRHRKYIAAMKARGLCVTEGYFSDSGQEKQTDVNIVVQMLSDAVKRQCDKCALFSADNDFAPALKAVSDLSEGTVKTLLVIPPCAKGAKKLSQSADWKVKITSNKFKGNALPEKLETDNGVIQIPEEYQLF